MKLLIIATGFIDMACDEKFAIDNKN